MYVATSAGRCRPCHRRYVWPSASARLSQMRCVRCRRPLSRASQLGSDTTVTLSGADIRELLVSGATAGIPLDRSQPTFS